nr:hypothetical protein [Moorella thermoacetica]
MGYLAHLIVQVYPRKATTEHLIHRRRGKVYLDYLQNVQGRSMTFPYSLRPLPGAPVSAPLTWEEVAAKKIYPGDFNIIRRRLEEWGDLYRELLERPNDLTPLLELAI